MYAIVTLGDSFPFLGLIFSISAKKRGEGESKISASLFCFVLKHQAFYNI